MNNDVVASEIDAPDSALDLAVRSVLAAPLPEDAIQRVKTRALNLAHSSMPAPPRTATSTARRWKSPRMIAGSFAAAAMIAVAVVGLALLSGPSANRGFAQMIEKVAAARTVQFHCTSRMGSDTVSGPVYVAGNRVRQTDDNNNTVIADLDSRTALSLDTAGKRYRRTQIDDAAAARTANPVERLRNISPKDAARLREEEVDGRTTIVYRLDNPYIFSAGWHNSETVVWVDAENNLPAKMVIRSLDPNTPIEVEFSNFVWDAPLDPELFSLEIPQGYEPVTDLPAEAAIGEQRDPSR